MPSQQRWWVSGSFVETSGAFVFSFLLPQRSLSAPLVSFITLNQ